MRIFSTRTQRGFSDHAATMVVLSASIVLLALATPAQAQVGFGRTVAVGQEEVFIGEPGNLLTPGFVYVYRPRAGGWEEAQRLTRSKPTSGDGFGQTIALDGDTLLVSATPEKHGAVFVFQRGSVGWTEVGRITRDQVGGEDLFGGALAVSGDLVLVGASGHSENVGAAYIFRRQDEGWIQVTELLPEGAEKAAPAEAVKEAQRGEEVEGDHAEPGEEADSKEGEESKPRAPRFGAAVAIEGDWAMIGAPEESGTGRVYVFHREADSWKHVAKLPSDGGQEGASFGSTIVLSDGSAIIGAIGENTTGAVQLYRLEDDQWTAEGGLRPFDSTGAARFGASIVADEGEVLVGAPSAAGSQGRIYRFGRSADGVWTDATKLAISGLGRGAGFASSLAKRGDLLVAGIPGDDYGAGTAVIMERSFGGWDRVRVVSDARGLDPVLGGPIECADGKASIFPCENFDLISFLPVHAMGGGRGVWANDIWGWTDPETGRDYALVGLSDRASFVDVTDPYSPVYVGNLPRTEGSPGSAWRDIKVHADHAFIVSDAAETHGVQIFDLTRLRRFEGTPIEFTEDAHYGRINSAHNIVMNESTAFAYVVGASGGGETCGGGLHMINVEDPREPIFAGCFADISSGRRKTGYSHDAQCVVYHGPDERYEGHELCFGSNETALSIADVTDKRSPLAVAMATYPNVAYTHQGWLTEDHRYFYINDEGDEISGTVDGTRTLIFDVQELDDPILVSEYIHDVESIDHNLYIVGNRMFQSNYNAGLRVLDISDPENPEMVGYFDTVPWGENNVVAPGEATYESFSWSNYPFFEGGFVLVTSTREGLFIVKEQGDGPGANARGSTYDN